VALSFFVRIFMAGRWNSSNGRSSDMSPLTISRIRFPLAAEMKTT
jgi:hypothetical protein